MYSHGTQEGWRVEEEVSQVDRDKSKLMNPDKVQKDFWVEEMEEENQDSKAADRVKNKPMNPESSLKKWWVEEVVEEKEQLSFIRRDDKAHSSKLGLDLVVKIEDGAGSSHESELADAERTLNCISDLYDFFCPKCNSCISKMIILRRKRRRFRPLPPSPSPILNLGSKMHGGEAVIEVVENKVDTIHNKTHLATYEQKKEVASDLQTLHSLGDSHDFYCPNCKSCITRRLITRRKKQQFPLIHKSGDSVWDQLKEIVTSDKGEKVMDVISRESDIVTITSLVIVTSAATNNIPSGNIVAFGLTNLIAGLFTIRHDVAAMVKKHKLKKGSSTEIIKIEEVDQYKEIRKERLLYLVYFTVTFFTFLLFGVLPPLVYALTFSNTTTENEDLKLLAMVGVSLVCTTLLSIFKVHITKPQNWVAYAKIVIYNISVGAVVFGSSYLAGNLIEKLAEKFGWFE